MGSIALVVPEATTNLVTNPSLETDTTGYVAANGATLTRITTAQRRGVYSLNVAPTAATDDGVYWPITLVAATEYAHSFDFKGQDKIPYRAYLYDVTGAVILGQPFTFTGDDEWHRYAFIESTLANTSHRLYIVKNNHANTGAFQVDGVQIEAKSFATTYCDGDQGGCSWNGVDHASTSSRAATERAGGRVVDPEDEYGLAIETLTGLGMPPNTLNSVSYSQLPGGFLNSIKVESRTMQFAVVTLSEDEETLYSARRQLIAALSQFRYQTAQPILLRYKRQEREIEIPVYYDSGLEGRFDEFYEKIPLRLIAYDPYFKETSEEGAALDLSIDSLASTTMFKWVDGVWSVAVPGSGSSGTVNAIADMGNGTWVICGSFPSINGDTDQASIALYNPNTGAFTDIATGGSNGTINAAVVASDGTLYVTGSFTTIGGVAANRIAKYSSSTWAAMGSGLSGTGTCLAIDTDGLPIVGGAFVTANGVTVNGIAKWTGATFTGYGSTPGISAGTVTANALLMIPGTSTFYASGQWTTMDGVSNTGRIAKWNGTAWVALSSQGGADNQVVRLKYGLDKKVYLGGSFTTIGGISTTDLARYNGSYYENINAQIVGGSTNGLSFDDNGFMWASGTSTYFSNWPTILDKVGRWDGTVFRTPFINFPADVIGLIDAPDGGMWVSITGSGGVADPAAQTTIIYNGDIPGYPVIKIKRTGGTSATLYGIRNLTTGVELLFNTIISDGEELTIDLSQTSKPIFSNYRGLNFTSYLPGSKVTGFNLLNGDNLIEVFIVSTGSPTLTGTMRWRNQYESVDGAIL